MKFIAGHNYLKGPTGDVVPYSDVMEKASGYKLWIPEKTITIGEQLEANEKIRSAPEKNLVIAAKEVTKKPQPVKKMVHQDIREEMKQDLSDLEG